MARRASFLGYVLGELVPRIVWTFVVTLPQKLWRRVVPALIRPAASDATGFSSLPILARGALVGAPLAVTLFGSFLFAALGSATTGQPVLGIPIFFLVPLLASLLVIAPSPLHLLAIGAPASPEPAWVSEPPTPARLALLASPIFLCCGFPVLLELALVPYRGLHPVPAAAASPAATPAATLGPRPFIPATPVLRKPEAGRVELSGWRFDKKARRVVGFFKAQGELAVTAVEVDAYYLDDDGHRIGDVQGIATETLLPGERTPARIFGGAPPASASDKIEVAPKKVTLDDVRAAPASAAADADKVSLKVMAVKAQFGEERIELELRNLGFRPLVGFRTRLHFLDAGGHEVAAWLFDTFPRFGGKPVSWEPRSWWFGSFELPVPAGYVRDVGIKFDHGGPEGWTRTAAAVKVEVLAAWWEQ